MFGGCSAKMNNDQLNETITFSSEVFLGLDNLTLMHSQRVQKLALFLGKTMKLTSDELNALGVGALLHDVGKQYIPQEILQKHTPLSPSDWDSIHKHPIHGWAYANRVGLNDNVKNIILNHHLWYNGEGGYPRTDSWVTPGPLTQITSVADVFDATLDDRLYRPGLPLRSVVSYLEEQSGSQFSPDVVKTLFDHLSKALQIIGK